MPEEKKEEAKEPKKHKVIKDMMGIVTGCGKQIKNDLLVIAVRRFIIAKEETLKTALKVPADVNVGKTIMVEFRKYLVEQDENDLFSD